MRREEVLEILRSHAAELQSEGVTSASLFGSMARGEVAPKDVDLAVRLSERFSDGGLDYFWRKEQLRAKLGALLGCPVDIVAEPARKGSLQQEIDRDRVLVF
ncbi:nucleotidyltransferase [Bryobacterales bacterium F-183]|nr:nucleotidyltransferase [Bryobacterales bacterium F-183]